MALTLSVHRADLFMSGAGLRRRRRRKGGTGAGSKRCSISGRATPTFRPRSPRRATHERHTHSQAPSRTRKRRPPPIRKPSPSQGGDAAAARLWAHCALQGARDRNMASPHQQPPRFRTGIIRVSPVLGSYVMAPVDPWGQWACTAGPMARCCAGPSLGLRGCAPPGPP
jgi:hypothetical protein